MKYKRAVLIFLAVLIFSAFLVSCTKKETIFIDNGVKKIEIMVEVADTVGKRSEGLMFRKSLNDNAGMFFAFDNEYQYTFWMKNTLIPLDIVFISKNFEIVDIIYAEPCEREPCKSYTPKKYAQYVLEVNGNFTTKNNIKVGDKAILDEKFIENLGKGENKWEK